MKKLILILILFASLGAHAQMKQYYDRQKTTQSIDVPAGIGSQQAVFIGDTMPFWYKTTRKIPFGTTLRSAIAAGWLIADTTSGGGGGGGSMTWPSGSAGIPLYNGSSAWGTTITNNSTNWNTAYGWGNHAGLYESAISKSTGFLKWTGSAWSWDGSTYLTSYSETDPTIYSWAKDATKPTYTYSEVGAQVAGSYEVTSNKSTTTSTSTTLYPNWNGIKAYCDSLALLLARKASPTFTGLLTTTDLEVDGNAHFDSSAVTGLKAYGNCGSALTIYPTQFNGCTITRNASTTISIVGMQANQVIRIAFIHENSATAYSVAWNAGVTIKWSMGVAPTFTNTANAIDIVSIWYDGTNYYGTFVPNFY